MLVMETNEPTPTTEAAESGTPVAARRKPRKLVVALTALAILLCVLAAAFFAYASDSYHDLDANHRNLVSTETLPVQQGDNYLAFGDPNAAVGLVFYPGAKVEYSAYAPLMRDLAERGYLAVVVQMPFNFAFFDINAADRVRADFPDVGTWWVGGHSLGGSMAAQYASTMPATARSTASCCWDPTPPATCRARTWAPSPCTARTTRCSTAPNSRTTPTCCPREPKPWRSRRQPCWLRRLRPAKRRWRSSITPAEQQSQTADAIDRYIRARYAEPSLAAAA